MVFGKLKLLQTVLLLWLFAFLIFDLLYILPCVDVLSHNAEQGGHGMKLDKLKRLGTALCQYYKALPELPFKITRCTMRVLEGSQLERKHVLMRK